MQSADSHWPQMELVTARPSEIGIAFQHVCVDTAQGEPVGQGQASNASANHHNAHARNLTSGVSGVHGWSRLHPGHVMLV